MKHLFNHLKRTVVIALALVTSLGAWSGNSYGIPDGIQEGNILHCFCWSADQIIAELPNIAEAGFGAVQVSPLQGNANAGAEWYYAYLPYDFCFKSNGVASSKAKLTELCTEAARYGIKIVVDVVANHVNKASGYHDTWWDSNGRVRWNGGIDYSNRYSITHGQLGDYGDVNSESSEVQARAKAYVEELKACGVRGIRWDAAKHIGLPSEGCDFWSTVASVSDMWNYGEILDNPGGDGNTLMKEYTKYISVTDNGYSNSQCRSSVCNGTVPSSYAGWAAGTIADDKVVYWGESHDTYSNESHETTYISQDKIDRAWALGACRNGATSLYFSRPSATTYNAIKMGVKGSTHFTSKEIAAINHLRNAAVGCADYYTASNGVASITREGIGAAIIVGSGNSQSVSVTNGGGYCPAGTYTDEVSGNTFTVTSTTISGQVGSTGIAVIYNGTASTEPSMTLSPNGGTFTTETLNVTATLSNATSGYIKVNGGAQQSFTSTKTFTIGEGVDYGSTITVTWSATGDEGTKTGTVTFSKQEAPAGYYVYFNNSSNWTTPCVWAWSETINPCTNASKWPGDQMTLVSGNTYMWTAPDGKVPTQIIFSNNGSSQTSDLDFVNGATYNPDGTYTGGGVTPTPTPSTGDITVYYDNSTSAWSSVYVHYWGTTETKWPGVQMTLVSDNIYKATLPAGTTGVVFNNGGNGKQTNDVTSLTDKHVYKGTTADKGDASDEGEYNGGSTDPDPDPDPTPDPDPVDPTPTPAGNNLITDYYKVNPNGQYGTNKTVKMSFNGAKSTTALSDWTASDLIAQGVARDVCQAFKGVHERPIVDSYAMYAAYDDDNLYLGVQFVYTVWDSGGEGYQAGESKPYNMDGKLWFAFDLDPDKSWDGTMTTGATVWEDAKYTTFNNGVDCMWLGSTKPGSGTPGLFFPQASTGKADYNDTNSCKTSNVKYGYADGLLPSITAIYGQESFGYDPELLKGNTGFVDLRSQVSSMGGDDTAHTFYEFTFPLADLGITKDYIKNTGIGVMFLDMYGSSAHAALPYDPSMFDNVFEEYSADPSSSKEKEDQDVVTYAPARIGKAATTGINNVTTTAQAFNGECCVYSLNGSLLVKADNLNAAKSQLPKGVYVVNGKKVIF